MTGLVGGVVLVYLEQAYAHVHDDSAGEPVPSTSTSLRVKSIYIAKQAARFAGP